ncbi:MAG: undecaprenyl-diphosphate phosphatase [Alphaproteobacteria bacterium]|nr:undecaprenyl-diphosphate phosphatase [Alphaproteobacteria bacterium]
MALFPLIILALVQGITEFLPISSSGHLILVHTLFGEDQSWDNTKIMDVAVHVGTLLSVLLYFRKDVRVMGQGIVPLLTLRFEEKPARLNLHILIASIPVLAVGLALHILQPSWLLLTEIVAWTTLIFGIVLWIADRKEEKSKTLDDLNVKEALLIGLAQMLALIPGTSRSGITMTASRFLGYTRTESARFSLLLSIIAITGAGALGVKDVIQSGDAVLGMHVLIAVILSFVSGWVAIALMMKWLQKSTFTPFAIYRIILGAALLVILYGFV